LDKHEMARIDETRPFIPVRIAVLTVSDTRSLADDKSGNTLADLIGSDGHFVADRDIVRDDVEAIRARVERWIDDPGIDVVISTGGTGFTGRDVTPEALMPLFEKVIEGFAIVFHMQSYAKIETSTIQSRACAGLTRGTYIFCLPGSPGACRDAWTGILKWQLDNRHRPCNFVEIMPRLEEHRRPG
jgi:molybdopterin adenylyltransferase